MVKVPTWRPLPAACLGAAAVLVSTPALADEGGVPFWFSGQYASLAAVPTTPGWYLPMQGNHYSGDASGSTSLTRGDSIALGLKSRTGLLLAQPTYAPTCAAKQGLESTNGRTQ